MTENIQEPIQEEQAPIVEEVAEQEQEIIEGSEQPQEDVDKSAYDEGKRFAEIGAKKSIAKEVSKRKRLEQRLDAVMQQNQEILEHINNQKANTPPPNYQDFQDSENPEYEYQKAMHKHLNKKSVPKEKASPAQKAGDIDQHAEQSYIAKENIFAKNNPDYNEAKQNLTPFLQGNSELINILHEAGPEVVHHLGVNIELADEISGMSPVQMGRRLAKLESELKPKGAAPRAPKRQSEPISSPRSSGRGVKSIADMSQAEYNKFMSDPNNF
jgi:hypothetical protein